MKTFEPTPTQNALVRWVAKPDSMWIAIYHGILRWATKGEAVGSAGKKMQITIETHTITILRRHHSRRTWCHKCAREVEVVGMEEAGLLAGMTQPALRDWAQTQGWHLSDAGDGTLLICLESLLKAT